MPPHAFAEVHVDYPVAGVARITLNRPERRNALTPEMRERLSAVVVDAMSDPATKALLLTGAGGAFCAGGDVGRLAALPKGEVESLLRSGHRLVRALIEGPKPVIAAVSGPAAGGGLGLALACDTVVIADDARLVLPFHKLALIPDYGLSYTLARRLGPARATRLMMNPQPIGAKEALQLGLADHLCGPGDLQQTAIELAISYSRQSPLAMAGIKVMMLAQSPDLQATLDLEVQVQSECFASPDFAAGAAEFLAGRRG